MKKIIIMVAAVNLLASCSSTGSGALNGAWLGGAIGSAVGGIAGGPRGSDIGTLVGMAVGTGTGVAVASATQESRRQQYRELSGSSNDYAYSQRQSTDNSGRSDKPIYDDVIEMSPSGTTHDANGTQPSYGISTMNLSPLLISNVRFINDSNTEHISPGELVKIAFEVRNTSNETMTQVLPVVSETTGNKRLHVSPSTLIETLESKKAIRYTAYVSAQKNLRNGTARFSIKVYSGQNMVSNTVEFDVALN